MKITPSVLIAGLSGSAGDVTAATWKGRLYARRRVTPANPKSVAQTAQRVAFAAVVTCYQQLSTAFKEALDKVGADFSYSGFNAMMKACIKAERDEYGHRIFPANRYAETLQSFAAATGAGASGDIDITWAAGDYLAEDTIWVFTREIDDVGPTFLTPWEVFDASAFHMDDEAAVITGLTANKEHQVCMVPYDTSETSYGGGDFDQATSKT